MPRLHLLLPACLLSLLYAACHNTNNSAPTGKPFLPNTPLPAQTFSIDVRNDTVLHTAGGALITIPKGALRIGSGNIAQLQIREAYTVSEMISAGLVTRSGDEPLSSGGMISIRAGSGTGVEIIRGIPIAIPAAYTRPGMQVYKGAQAVDGAIDWQNPAPLDTAPRPALYTEGKSLYNANCASCHNLAKDATGPALAYITSRRSMEWLHGFTRNPSGMIASGDPYANALYCRWKPTIMTAFPMDDASVHAIYDYIAEESKNIDPAGIRDDKASFDSCALYRKTIRALQENNDDLLTQRGGRNGSTQTVVAGNDVILSTSATRVFYRFTVRDTGWYNVDILTKNLPGFTDSRLAVRIAGSHSRDLTLYLILPDDKILLNGGPMDGSRDAMYAFYKKDGSIPLPQGRQAYLIAMQEAGDKLLFAQDAFITGASQERSLTLQEITVSNMNKAIAGIGIKDLGISADSAKNATVPQSKNKALKAAEGLMPKNIPCDCGTSDSSSSAWKAELFSNDDASHNDK